jgi:hypothetical protein
MSAISGLQNSFPAGDRQRERNSGRVGQRCRFNRGGGFYGRSCFHASPDVSGCAGLTYVINITNLKRARPRGGKGPRPCGGLPDVGGYPPGARGAGGVASRCHQAPYTPWIARGGSTAGTQAEAVRTFRHTISLLTCTCIADGEAWLMVTGWGAGRPAWTRPLNRPASNLVAMPGDRGRGRYAAIGPRQFLISGMDVPRKQRISARAG